MFKGFLFFFFLLEDSLDIAPYACLHRQALLTFCLFIFEKLVNFTRPPL